MDRILREDLEILCRQDYIDFKAFKDTSFLVTGATGLLGSTITKALVHISQEFSLDIRIKCLVRDRAKAERVFDGDTLSYSGLSFTEVSDLSTYSDTEFRPTYILHLASPTDSAYFINHPAELLDFDYRTTKKLLELARSTGATFVYFSSMEVYGTPKNDVRICEAYTGSCPDTMAARSSYSEGKRMCEALCTAYAAEFSIPVHVLRLTQTFGPGVARDDNRVFAQFARSAVEGKDIVLKTNGDTKRYYLYPMDLVSALLAILQSGRTGEAWNVANEESYCSILEMAQMVCEKIAGGRISVKIALNEEDARKYLPPLCMNLDTGKLRGLGWKAVRGLEEMFSRMLASFQHE